MNQFPVEPLTNKPRSGSHHDHHHSHHKSDSHHKETADQHKKSGDSDGSQKKPAGSGVYHDQHHPHKDNRSADQHQKSGSSEVVSKGQGSDGHQKHGKGPSHKGHGPDGYHKQGKGHHGDKSHGKDTAAKDHSPEGKLQPDKGQKDPSPHKDHEHEKQHKQGKDLKVMDLAKERTLRAIRIMPMKDIQNREREALYTKITVPIGPINMGRIIILDIPRAMPNMEKSVDLRKSGGQKGSIMKATRPRAIPEAMGRDIMEKGTTNL